MWVHLGFGLDEGRKPLLYPLDHCGAELVSELTGKPVDAIDWRAQGTRSSLLFIEHDLACNTVRVAFQVAAEREGYRILSWFDDRALKSPQMKDVVALTGPRRATSKASVVPDAFFVLDTPERTAYHSVELDLGTVTGRATPWMRRDFARKIAADGEYFRSGLYEKRWGVETGRVLIIAANRQRLENLKRITEEEGGRARHWFALVGDIQAKTVLTEPIWQKAGAAGVSLFP